MSDNNSRISVLLRDWRAGATPPDSLVSAVYKELRKVASHQMKAEAASHTLQPTALVHEAWMRLASADVDWKDRAHFFALAARTMRRVLVDHARAKGAQRRGDGTILVQLDEAKGVPAEPPTDVVGLDEALSALSEEDPRMGRIVELRYFGGLEYEEIAEVLSISKATVGRELRLARARLRRALGSSD